MPLQRSYEGANDSVNYTLETEALAAQVDRFFYDQYQNQINRPIVQEHQQQEISGNVLAAQELWSTAFSQRLNDILNAPSPSPPPPPPSYDPPLTISTEIGRVRNEAARQDDDFDVTPLPLPG